MHIKEHPGIRYRQRLRLSGCSNVRMSFHLKEINKSKLVKAKRLTSNKRIYYLATVKATESDILDHLLEPTRKEKSYFSYLNIAMQDSKKLSIITIELHLPHHFSFNVWNMQGLSRLSK